MHTQLLLIFLGIYLGVEFLGHAVACLTGSAQSIVLLLGGGWLMGTDVASTLTLTFPLMEPPPSH